jgi:hypothetical protein
MKVNCTEPSPSVRALVLANCNSFIVQAPGGNFLHIQAPVARKGICKQNYKTFLAVICGWYNKLEFLTLANSV